MKMFLPATMPESGVITWQMTEGAPIAPGALLATCVLDDPDCVQKADLFTETLLSYIVDGSRAGPHLVLRNSVNTLEMVMQGFAVPENLYEKALEDLSVAITDPLLPLLEFNEALSVLSGRLDATVYNKLKEIGEDYRKRAELQGRRMKEEFPVNQIIPLIDEYGKSLPERDQKAYGTLVESLRGIADQYANGIAGRTVVALLSLVRQYLSVERNFAGYEYQDVVARLRKQHSSDPQLVYDMCRSHSALQRKNKLLLTLLEHIGVAALAARDLAQSVDGSMSRSESISFVSSSDQTKMSIIEGSDVNTFLPVLSEISNLTDKSYAVVANTARSILIEQKLPSVDQRRKAFKVALEACVDWGNKNEEEQRQIEIEQFLSEDVGIRDLLFYYLGKGPNFKTTALEIYIRKIYKLHAIKKLETGNSISSDGKDDCTWVTWDFTSAAPEPLPAGVGSTSSYADLTSLSRNRSHGTLGSGNESDNAHSDAEGNKIPSNAVRNVALLTPALVNSFWY
jgi:acetyl-CoA carboxylase/biotin carboxylase 1